MYNNTKAIFILRYEPLTPDNILRAYRAKGEIKMDWLEADVHLFAEGKHLKIMEISFLLKEMGYLETVIMGYKITGKGRWHLIKISSYWNYYAVLLAIFALIATILSLKDTMKEQQGNYKILHIDSCCHMVDSDSSFFKKR